jgi:hypothetical protein
MPRHLVTGTVGLTFINNHLSAWKAAVLQAERLKAPTSIPSRGNEFLCSPKRLYRLWNPPSHVISGFLAPSPGLRQTARWSNRLPYTLPSLKMSGAVPPLQYKPPWHKSTLISRLHSPLSTNNLDIPEWTISPRPALPCPAPPRPPPSIQYMRCLPTPSKGISHFTAMQQCKYVRWGTK